MQAMEFDLRRCHSGIWSVAQLPFSAHIEHHRLGGHQLQLPLLPHLSCQERHRTWYHHPVTRPDNVCLPVCLSLPAPIWLPRKASHMVSSPGIACRQCLSVCLCFCLCLPACLPIALPMCLCIYLYVCLSASATHWGQTCCTS